MNYKYKIINEQSGSFQVYDYKKGSTFWIRKEHAEKLRLNGEKLMAGLEFNSLDDEEAIRAAEEKRKKDAEVEAEKKRILEEKAAEEARQAVMKREQDSISRVQQLQGQGQSQPGSEENSSSASDDIPGLSGPMYP